MTVVLTTLLHAAVQWPHARALRPAVIGFFTGWPLSRQCEIIWQIPWHFPDGFWHSCPAFYCTLNTHYRIVC